MNQTSRRNGVPEWRPRLAAAALGALALPAFFLGGGCAASPDGTNTDTDGQLGQAKQNLTQCVTFQRGVSGTVADAMLSSPPAGQNYGAGPILRVGGKDESLLRFDLSSIPASAVVNSATLKLYVNGSAGDLAVNIHAATAAWSEGSVTFESFGQHYANAVSGALQPSSPNALKSADITALVASWVSGAQANSGMLLETTDKKKSIFVSGDASSNAQHPALTVCYTTPDDHCSPNPCAHGSCQNGASSYTCACSPGWTGQNCDVNMHECDDQPCLNGASCTNQPNGYACSCAPGYTGTHCETLVDNCASHPCQNAGVCTNGVNSYACACAPGFSGTNCETNINDCAPAPCVHGACADGVNSYACSCQTGWTGQNCDVDIDDCVGNQCQNGATCVDGLASYTCACLPGFGGTYCQNNLNECGTNPCLNGASCTNGVNSYTCQCAPGYEGANCQIDHNDCAPNPCQNGGICVDGVNSYTCQCAAGYTGTNCDQATASPCDAHPCQNGGTCVANGSSYTCDCPVWTLGATCEVACPCVTGAQQAGDTATYGQWSGAASGALVADSCESDGAGTEYVSTGVSWGLPFSAMLTLTPTYCRANTLSGEATSAPGWLYPVNAAEAAACKNAMNHVEAAAGLTCTATEACPCAAIPGWGAGDYCVLQEGAGNYLSGVLAKGNSYDEIFSSGGVVSQIVMDVTNAGYGGCSVGNGSTVFATPAQSAACFASLLALDTSGACGACWQSGPTCSQGVLCENGAGAPLVCDDLGL